MKKRKLNNPRAKMAYTIFVYLMVCAVIIYLLDKNFMNGFKRGKVQR